MCCTTTTSTNVVHTSVGLNTTATIITTTNIYAVCRRASSLTTNYNIECFAGSKLLITLRIATISTIILCIGFSISALCAPYF